MSNESHQDNHSAIKPSNTHPSLQGVRVLIARPKEQGAALAALLKQLGAKALQLPAIEIQPSPSTQALKSCFLNLDQYDHIIAISTHAAHYGLQWIDQYWPQLPVDTKWYAVGKKTASILDQADISVITPNQGYDSESLLNLPELKDLDNQNVLILRGVGGRELLKQKFEQRGAKVTYAELYQRACPSYMADDINDALVKFSPDILVTLSGDTLHNLVKMSQNKNIACEKSITITDKVVLVPSNRVAEQARSLGFKKIWVPQELNEQALIECISSNCLTLNDKL